MDKLSAEERERLCDQVEVCHIDYIQPFGYLLVIDRELKVLQASENVAAWIGVDAQQVINKTLDDIPEREIVDDIKKYLSKIDRHQETTQSHTNQKHNYDLHIQDKGSFIILEFMPFPEDCHPIDFQEFSSQILSLTNRSDQLRTFAQTCQLFTEKIKKTLGFDKVLIYQFLDDGSGTVIAEARETEMEDYLNFHFPKSDIPKPVRQLYLKNPLRYIYDSQQDPVSIVPSVNPLTKKPLDLSFSILKGVVPVHRDYINHMHIRTSISYGIRVRGKLWGLISCHNREPKFLSRDHLLALTHFSCLLSDACASHGLKEFTIAKKQYDALSEAIEVMGHKNIDIHEDFLLHADAVLAIANAEGAAMNFEGKLTKKGLTPGDKEIKHLIKWLDQNQKDRIFHTDSLSEIIPEAAKYKEIASGMISASMGSESSNYCLWFRPEFPSTIKWAGNPQKLDTTPENPSEFKPRKSFELWREEIKGRSKRWRARELEAISQLNKEMNLSFLSIYYTKKMVAESELFKVQMAADYASEGIFILNEMGAVEWMNKPLKNLLEISTSQDEKAPFPSLLQMVTDSNIGSIKRSIAANEVNSSEVVLGGKTILIMMSPFSLPGEKDNKFFGITTDITEIKNVQEQLAEKVNELHTTNQQLSELIAVKDKFIRMAAHDLRNPISSILMAGSILDHAQKNDEKESASKMIDLISRQAKGMLDLLNDILNDNLIDSGQFQINKDEVDIKSLVQEVCDFHKLLATEKNVEILLEVNLERPICSIDRIKIKQVMDNFLSNAIKFSPQDSVIKVFCRTTPTNLRFEVCDQGSGIPEKSKETVFKQPIKKVSQGADEETHGLGLTICRQIINAYNGKLGFKNLPEGGASFYFEVDI